MFVAPRRTRKPFLFVLEIVFPIIAACPLPRPGRKLHNGEAIIAPKSGRKSFVFGFVIFCFGILVLFFIESMSVEEPKSPVSKGRRGWFRIRDFPKISCGFKIISPRIPVNKKTSRAEDFLFSKKIKRIETIIKI